MMNMQGLMKQAQMMQKKMEEAQKKLEISEVIGSSGGGMVKVTMNGKMQTKKVEIDKSLLDPEEVDVLEDLIVAACNDAQNKAENMMGEDMKNITGGLNLKLPF
ncbi:MAG: YbaB/EbfC family nucleoid-associated protein [Alphaproteobacteria bacterium]|nr:YbaB/EbfC family nucleoid-associated protein [Alphaproteobacteria bacterium]